MDAHHIHACTIKGGPSVKTKLLALGIVVAAGLYVLAGCSSDHGTGPSMGHVSVRLTDAPGDYEQVNIVVDQISVHRDGDDAEGWETLALDSTTTFDLIQLQGGVLARLADGDVPAGHYTQVRLHIAEGSNVVVDGTTYPLKVPSGMQSGYKLIGGFDVPAGGAVELTLDFDAARSIVHTGNGKYMLKPTCRLIVNRVENTGAITGHLLPEGVVATIEAVADTGTVQTTSAGTDGRFTLAQLLPGTYSVAIHPADTLRDTTLTGVSVTAGQTTDVGDVQLEALETSASARLAAPARVR
jgi:hypothetical protein